MDLVLEAELGRLKEPMVTVFFPEEAPLEEEDRPPSTESSSSKFLSGGRERDKQGETQ